MGNPRLKHRTPINSAIRNEYKAALVDLSKKTRINQSVLLDQAMCLLFKEHGIDPNDYIEEDEEESLNAC